MAGEGNEDIKASQVNFDLWTILLEYSRSFLQKNKGHTVIVRIRESIYDRIKHFWLVKNSTTHRYISQGLCVSGLWAQQLRISHSVSVGNRTYHVFTLVIVQNHLSVVAVDTDVARRKMSTVATFSVVRSSTVSLRVSLYLVKEEESVRRPFQFKLTVKYTLNFNYFVSKWVIFLMRMCNSPGKSITWRLTGNNCFRGVQ